MNEQQSSSAFKISTTTTYLFLYIIANLCLFISGLTFSNILHFSIEDHFHQPLESSFFFGREYALSLSWLLMTSLIYIILTFVIKHNQDRYFEIFFTKGRIRTLNVLLCIGYVFTFLYVVNIIYSFFSGHSDSYGLLRIGVTFTLLILGIVYTFFESRYFNISKNKFYLFSITTLLCFMNIWSINLTFKYASPHMLKQYKEDAQKIHNVKTIAIEIKKYYQNFGRLPVALNILNDYGFLSSVSSIQDYTYKAVTNQSFDICTTFEKDSEAARRITRHKPFNYHFQKGRQCERFFLKKIKAGGFVLKSDFSPNITIQFYGNE